MQDLSELIELANSSKKDLDFHSYEDPFTKIYFKKEQKKLECALDYHPLQKVSEKSSKQVISENVNIIGASQ